MSTTKCSGPSLSVSVDSSSNQITNTGFSYDAAGNTTADGAYTYAYNAENEVTSTNAGVNYTGACPEPAAAGRRDGDGLRVEKSSGTLYWRSYAGQVIEETNSGGTVQTDYIFFAGRRIAWRDSSGNVYYDFVDVIGSTRAVTNSTGSVCFSADYYPFGQENDYTTSCTPTHKFAGYEYDSEMGNYYAMARYYDPRLGRFMSPDPLGGAVVDPQSLNRYTYVLNNPETFVDPWGLCGQPTTFQYAYTPKQGTYAVLYVDPSCNPAGPPIGIWWSGEGAMPYAPLLGPPSFKPGGVFPHVGAQPQTTGKVARCAANLANTMSVAHYAHLQNVPVASNIFSNDFSSLTNLFFGPGRPGAAVGLAENLGSGPALSLTGKGAGAVTVDSGFQFLFSSAPATTFGETAIGGVLTKSLSVAADWLSGEAEAQAIYDAGIYTGAVYVCAAQ